MSYKVKINIFEGPFDLLVYLIENARMSIYDIKVSEITAQYIKYIEEMEKMDVLPASEFMVLAATLIDIKSKMLLPKQIDEEEGSIGEDPRTELVQKLIEYKKFKNASEILARKEEDTSRILDKPQEDLSFFTNEPDEYLKLNINQFVKAFNDFLIRKKKVDEIRRNYERDERQRITTEVRMDFIRDLILKWPEKLFTFKELVPDTGSKYDTALSFVSTLEMIKQRRIEARQKTLFGEIKINATAYLDDGKEEEPDDKQKIN